MIYQRKKMTKRVKAIRCTASFVLAVGLSFISCNIPGSDGMPASGDEEQYVPLRERVSVDSLESGFSKAVWHMVSAAEKGIETVEYYVDIPEHETARATKQGSFDAQSLGKYLPSDLSTLKRKTPRNTLPARSSADLLPEDFELETISLQDELDIIIDEFNEAMKPLIPDLDEVELPEGVAVEDGFIRFGG